MQEANSALTEDAFLGGRLRLLQPVQGYRAGVDPVLLAASVPAKLRATGAGLGMWSWCGTFLSRMPGARVVTNWYRASTDLC